MESMESKIPTHDPYTGELNPYYEELTGKKNPLLGDVEETNNCFDLKKLVGKKFRYNGKYGLSDWTDTVRRIDTRGGVHTNWSEYMLKRKNGDNSVKLEVFGSTYELFVTSSRSGQHYEFENCVFIND